MTKLREIKKQIFNLKKKKKNFLSFIHTMDRRTNVTIFLYLISIIYQFVKMKRENFVAGTKDHTREAVNCKIDYGSRYCY